MATTKKQPVVAVPEKGMTYFYVLKNGHVKEYYKTKKKLGDTVWVNKSTGNVSLKEPGVKSIANYQSYIVRKMVRPSEQALNGAWLVV